MTHHFNKSTKQWMILFLALGLVLASSNNAGAAKSSNIAGPVRAQVNRVIDGDTIRVKANIWIGQHIVVLVRLAGIDAPELHRGSYLDRQRGAIARTALKDLVEGQELSLRNIRLGKYAGRVIADVYLNDGTDISALMLERGLAEPYRKRSHKKYRCRGYDCRYSKLD